MMKKVIVFLVVLIAIYANIGYRPVMAAGLGNLTDDDLIANWKFDEEDGNTVNDEKGNYNGTSTGTTIIDGVNGKARKFDGDDYIEFNDKIVPVGAKTIRFKIRISRNDPWGYIMTNTTNHSPGYNDNGINIQSYDNKVHVKISKNNECIVFLNSKDIGDGTWHDVIFTWNGTTGENMYQLYVDDMTVPCSMTTSKGVEEKEPSLNLLIGRKIPTSNNMFNGDLDEVEIYNKFYEPPTAPINLEATPNKNQIKLTWNAVSEAEKYIVKKATAPGTDFTILADDISETSYIDTDVNVGETYYYVVCAVQNESVSKDSSKASATIPEQTSEKALLLITLQNGLEKEYEMSMDKIDDFITWYDNRAEGNGSRYYMIFKQYNLGTFKARKDYIIFNKIMCFEVLEYLE